MKLKRKVVKIEVKASPEMIYLNYKCTSKLSP